MAASGHAAEEVVAPLADSSNNDRDDVQEAQRDIGDSVESRLQDECGEHHQARDDDIRSRSKKERLVDGEPTDLSGFEVRPDVRSVEAEEIDIGKDEQHRRPQCRDLGPDVHGGPFELRFGD